MLHHCPICHAFEQQTVLEMQVPVLLSLPKDALPGSNILVPFHLTRCPSCGHLYNGVFDSSLIKALYSDGVVTNIPADPSMLARYTDLLDWLKIADQRPTTILEIGCGGGHLARLLATIAPQVDVVEPNRHLTKNHLPEKNITLLNGIFPHPDCRPAYDYILCRQVIEHVSDPRLFLAAISKLLAPGGKAYLEMPDARFITRNGAFMDLHIQHIQYFTPSNFERLAYHNGLIPLRTLNIMHGHDFGMLLEKVENPLPPMAIAPPLKIDSRKFDRLIENARQALCSLPKPLALYGATAHGQSFINAIGSDTVFTATFDDNPSNWENVLYTDTSTIPIIRPDPECLKSCGSVIITAYLHDRVIARKLRDMGFQGSIVSISPVHKTSTTIDSIYMQHKKEKALI